MTEITRSNGYVVNGGHIVGGGHSGLTQQLDEIVKRQAEWLREQFPDYAVQIRFNSDRKSGGAFIESSHTLDGVVYIKLGASLRCSKSKEDVSKFNRGELSLDEYLKRFEHRMREYDYISYDVGINAVCTINTCGEDADSFDMIWKDFNTYEEAIEYIKEHVKSCMLIPTNPIM